MTKKTNLHVISLVDVLSGQKIYRVRCVCGSVGKITETGLLSKVSCGCTNVVAPYKLGLRVVCYTFKKFLREEGDKHIYEIECDHCQSTSEIDHRYRSSRCPTCPIMKTYDGIEINLTVEAARLGIHVSSLDDRLKRMPVHRALNMPKTNHGGKKGIHGKCTVRGFTSGVAAHLRRWGIYHRKPAVYWRIRSGVTPANSVEYYLLDEGITLDIFAETV